MPIVAEKLAQKALRRIPGNVSRVIVGEIEGYAADPAAFANMVIAMKGSEHRGRLRMRVGDWRVLMRWEGDVLRIVDIAARGTIYE